MMIALLLSLLTHVSAHDSAKHLLLNSAVKASPSSPQPSLEECLTEAQRLNLSSEYFYVIRLSDFDFTQAPRGVYVEAYLCEDMNTKKCIKLKRSRVLKSVPVSIGLLPEEIACNIASQKDRDINLKYLNIRIQKQNLFTSELAFISYTNMSSLNKLTQTETAYGGLLQTFPARWPYNK